MGLCRQDACAPRGDDRMKAEVVEVSISKKKGVRKENIPEGILIENHGFKGDAHAGDWHRQVSLLAIESIDKVRAKGLEVKPGDFAENITTSGIDLVNLPIGTKLEVGEDVLMEVTQIGKVCHTKCAIYYLAGDCVMPREGIFTKVLKGGTVKKSDPIVVVE